ncbi:hypothetical protein [Liberiplasma polymorphum]|uniref:hypothetical protein n=1 Tax=Liberiplasma polymorphum TaxID=3374570 RepID=UPI0037761C9D
MFEIIAMLFIFSIFLALFISLGLLITRIVLVIKDKQPVKKALMIVLVPGSIGYYHYYPNNTPFKMWYQRLVLLMFIFTFIGSIYVAFLNIPELAH